MLDFADSGIVAKGRAIAAIANLLILDDLILAIMTAHLPRRSTLFVLHRRDPQIDRGASPRRKKQGRKVPSTGLLESRLQARSIGRSIESQGVADDDHRR